MKRFQEKKRKGGEEGKETGEIMQNIQHIKQQDEIKVL